MQILVDYTLFQRLVESIDKQAQLANQDEATQTLWKSVINSTYHEANTQLTRFRQENLIDSGRTETGQGPIIGPDKSSFV